MSVSQQDYKALVLSVEDKLQEITIRLVNGEIDKDTWHQLVSNALLDAHKSAAILGRKLLKDGDKLTSKDEEIAIIRFDWQSGYLQEFVNVLESKYKSDNDEWLLDSILSRLKLYPKALVTTADYSFVEYAGNADIIWKMSKFEHCKQCPYIAMNSPYKKWTLYTLPGAGDTDCKQNCGCYLVIGDITGFIPL